MTPLSLRGWRQLLGVALVALSSAAAFAQPGAPTLQGPQLLSALRSGGYILYFRHASTDFGQSDDRMTGYEDCATQRNLTDAGRDEARAIGVALRELAIPVGDVLASPFCRTMETARLMLGRAVAAPDVRGAVGASTADRYAGLRALLSTPVAGGANLVLVGHGFPFRAVAGEPLLSEGEAAVIEPRRDGFRVVARVPKDGWRVLGTHGTP